MNVSFNSFNGLIYKSIYYLSNYIYLKLIWVGPITTTHILEFIT